MSLNLEVVKQMSQRVFNQKDRVLVNKNDKLNK